MIQVVVNVLLILIAWFLLGIVLRDLRIWCRGRAIKRINNRFNKELTEIEIYGNELKPHRWGKRDD